MPDLIENVNDQLIKVMRGLSMDRLTAKETLEYIWKINGDTKYLLWGALFGTIQLRKPSFDEILGFLDAVIDLEPSIKKRIKIRSSIPVYSICGSGKDSLKTFNVSTAAAFVAAGAGVCIVKQGSYATSTVSGSSNVLQYLGVNIKSPVDIMCECAEENGIAYFDIGHCFPKIDLIYGRKFYFFHPLSYILGAILTPIKLDGIVFGISDPNTELCASLLSHIGFRNSLVICGMDESDVNYIDEISNFGPSKCTEIRNTIKTYTLFPEDFNVNAIHFHDFLTPQTIEEAAWMLIKILSGNDNGPRRDIVCMNAAVLIYSSGLTKDIKEAMEMSIDSINSKRSIGKLQDLIEGTGGNKFFLQSLINSC